MRMETAHNTNKQRKQTGRIDGISQKHNYYASHLRNGSSGSSDGTDKDHGHHQQEDLQNTQRNASRSQYVEIILKFFLHLSIAAL